MAILGCSRAKRVSNYFCDIWREIASRYSQETTILGYELMNEPIAHYFANKDSLYTLLQPLYQRCVKAIREVDQNPYHPAWRCPLE